jgi:hypothetical protein
MKKIALVTTLMVGSLFATQNQLDQLNNKNNNSNTQTIKQGTTNCNISQTPGLKHNCIITVEANGIGVAPSSSISPAQSTAMARRAAIIDGYKALTEKLYGIKINGRETVRNMVLQNSNLRSKVAGVIRGATIEEEDYKNGMYKVIMSLKLNVKNWNKYLKNNPPYSTTYYDN